MTRDRVSYAGDQVTAELAGAGEVGELAGRVRPTIAPELLVSCVPGRSELAGDQVGAGELLEVEVIVDFQQIHGVYDMPVSGLVAHGFGFSLGTGLIPTLGLGGAGPAPVPPRRRSVRLSSPEVSMSRFVTPPSIRLDWAPLVAADTPYATAKMLLYTNDLTPDENTIEADFTEATFGGYTAGGVAVTWDDPFIDAANLVHLPTDNIVFLCTGSPFEDIYGYYLIGAGGEYLGGARFDDAPRPIPAAGYGILAATEVIM